MNYTELETYLLNIFNEKNFIACWNNYKKLNNRSYLNSKTELLDKNLNLSISFPGYKTTQRYGKFVYDYRVNLNDIAISHTNIIVDIYNKCIQAPHLINNLYHFLLDISKDALNIDLRKHQILLNYKFKSPSDKLLDYASNIHIKNNKNFDRNANSWNYSLEELVSLISYIVLQEDINYPMPKFNGRRMSFYRYLEALICTRNNQYNLSDVIIKALSHSRPPLWNEYKRVYKPIEKLAADMFVLN